MVPLASEDNILLANTPASLNPVAGESCLELFTAKSTFDSRFDRINPLLTVRLSTEAEPDTVRAPLVLILGLLIDIAEAPKDKLVDPIEDTIPVGETTKDPPET